MTFFQALAYFLREALLSLARGFKVSLLAILTAAVSLFLGGVFLLLGGNLERMIEDWRDEAKIMVYLESGVDDAAQARLEARLRQAPFTSTVDLVDPVEARQRFLSAFPSLGDLLEGWEEEPLPASLEVGLDHEKPLEDLPLWLEEIGADPAVALVDDDRDWLEQLETVVLVIRSLGMVLGLILLGTAIVTIASVIRLTAYLYRDEIAVMRLVGATEFFIRGPFYMEGLIQGTLGALLAVTALFGAHAAFADNAGGSLLASLLTRDFLDGPEVATLIALGGLSGLVGAVASLRRESLGDTAEKPEWAAETQD